MGSCVCVNALSSSCVSIAAMLTLQMFCQFRVLEKKVSNLQQYIANAVYYQLKQSFISFMKSLVCTITLPCIGRNNPQYALLQWIVHLLHMYFIGYTN